MEGPETSEDVDMPRGWASLQDNSDVLGYLLTIHVSARDLLALERVCRALRTLVLERGVWQSVASREMCVEHAVRAGVGVQPHWKQLCCLVCTDLGPYRPVTPLADSACASHTDNPTEAASNLLSESPCHSDEVLGQRVCECRCSHGQPCYWSSPPFSSADAAHETLSFTLPHRCWSIVSGVALRPYRAHFHPGAPVYAPAEAQLTVRGSATTTRYAAQRIKGGPNYDMTAQDHMSLAAVLDRPLLLSGDDTIEIELRGAQQRCPLDGMHYMCVSHVSIHGWQLTKSSGPTGGLN